MFYTDLTVYPNLPETKIILELQKKGYRILMKDDDNISQDIRSTKGIEYVNLN
jgi:hypothetical protein